MASRIEKIERLIKKVQYQLTFSSTNQEFVEEIKEYVEDKDFESLYDLSSDLFDKQHPFTYIYGIGIDDENIEDIRIEILLLIKELDNIDNVYFQRAFTEKQKNFDLSTLN